MRVEGNGIHVAFTTNVEASNKEKNAKNVEKNYQNNEQQKIKVSKDDLDNMVKNVNKFLEPTQSNLKFQMHDKLHEYFVQIVDSNTKEVIREIPPKKFLDMYASMLEKIGIIVDHKI